MLSRVRQFRAYDKRKRTNGLRILSVVSDRIGNSYFLAAVNCQLLQFTDCPISALIAHPESFPLKRDISSRHGDRKNAI